MNHLDLRKAKAVYRDGGNITEFLRKEFDTDGNSSEIIEIAYDLQAGSYIEYATAAPEKAAIYAQELYTLLTPHLAENCSILDVGTGELTTLSQIANRFDHCVTEVFAFDISWSRLYKGMRYWNETVSNPGLTLTAFVADMKKIPLASKSIDIVTSSHALEPNGKDLAALLKELFRVCKKKCVLFEPYYEANSPEGQARMDRLGYIRGMEATVKSLGGTLVDVQLVKSTGNPLNPTACFVIVPPSDVGEGADISGGNRFTVPGTDFQLTRSRGFMASADTGLVFPVLDDIAILKESSSILASSLFD